ncbi:S8 family serine peptidase [Pacificoceanicola onchidii]|uniref:S8 family serine peptidase n=1 Tax=Pacificoceanicola onchidii TaxID=2562685 RepID=UPI0010A53FF4|nr:S8 family serine peptidase [Pacificoceanicola onchidii]
MALAWTPSQSATFEDAYLDWSVMLDRRRAGLAPAEDDWGVLYRPIFVRLTGPEARQGLITALAADDSLLMDGHEYAELSARAGAQDSLAGLPDEYALYQKVDGAGDHDALFTILDSGMPVRVATGPTTAPATHQATPSETPGQPIVAIVDDGLGFLNSRFLRQAADGSKTSRFHALWLQALEQRSGNARVTLGETFTQAEISAMLGGEESATYAAINARIYEGTRQSTGFSTSHGTHVLDLAAGAEPGTGDPAEDWPLLGVQLPPQAIEDTSGTRFESYTVQAVRWLLRRAGEVDATAPVIINLSLGILAGPKDGTRFVEYQIAREAAEWERVTGQPVRIVWSFGNNYESRLVSHHGYAAGAIRSNPQRKSTWRVQPADQTPSYLEIRVPKSAPGALKLELKAPGGPKSGFDDIAPGAWRTLNRDGEAVARIYHVPDRDLGNGVVSPAHYVLAIAPTEGRKAGEPEAPSGAWSVRIRHEGPEALDVVCQIQRDDGLRGYGAQARQSYFDDKHAFEWDAERQAYTGLADKSPITHDGSHSAMVTAPARQVFSVGAAVGSGTRNRVSPARYTAAGADWSVDGPTVSVIADDTRVHRGILASGTLTGSTRSLGGTSAAAGRLTRALALSAAQIAANAASPHTADLSASAAPLLGVAPEDAARLGQGVVALPDARARVRRGDATPLMV